MKIKYIDESNKMLLNSSGEISKHDSEREIEVGSKLISVTSYFENSIILEFDENIDSSKNNINNLFKININSVEADVKDILFLENNLILKYQPIIFYEDTKGSLNNIAKGSNQENHNVNERDLIKLVIDEKNNYDIHYFASRGLVEILDYEKNVISTIDFTKAHSDRNTNEYYQGEFGIWNYVDDNDYLKNFYNKSGQSVIKTQELDQGIYYLNVRFPDNNPFNTYELFVSSDSAKENSLNNGNYKEILISYLNSDNVENVSPCFLLNSKINDVII